MYISRLFFAFTSPLFLPPDHLAILCVCFIVKCESTMTSFFTHAGMCTVMRSKAKESNDECLGEIQEGCARRSTRCHNRQQSTPLSSLTQINYGETILHRIICVCSYGDGPEWNNKVKRIKLRVNQ